MIKAKNLPICAALFIILQALGLIFAGIDGYFDLAWLLQSILMMVLCVLMATSYKAHAKNVMKPLIGASLIVILGYEMDWAAEYIQYFDQYWGTVVDKGLFNVYVLLQILIAVIMILLNINHYLINRVHEGSPQVIGANKVLCILFAVFLVIQIIIEIVCGVTLYDTLATIFASISDVFMLAMIIIIEGLVDDFRIKREEA